MHLSSKYRMSATPTPTGYFFAPADRSQRLNSRQHAVVTRFPTAIPVSSDNARNRPTSTEHHYGRIRFAAALASSLRRPRGAGKGKS
jgi:hypothetical protein